jgi:hypothetical protein
MSATWYTHAEPAANAVTERPWQVVQIVRAIEPVDGQKTIYLQYTPLFAGWQLMTTLCQEPPSDDASADAEDDRLPGGYGPDRGTETEIPSGFQHSGDMRRTISDLCGASQREHRSPRGPRTIPYARRGRVEVALRTYDNRVLLHIGPYDIVRTAAIPQIQAVSLTHSVVRGTVMRPELTSIQMHDGSR